MYNKYILIIIYNKDTMGDNDDFWSVTSTTTTTLVSNKNEWGYIIQYLPLLYYLSSQED